MRPPLRWPRRSSCNACSPASCYSSKAAAPSTNPTLGFIGTVVGIALALREAGNMPNLSQADALGGWMKSLTGSLALAFNTTLLALALSAVLVFLTHLAQGRDS